MTVLHATHEFPNTLNEHHIGIETVLRIGKVFIYFMIYICRSQDE